MPTPRKRLHVRTPEERRARDQQRKGLRASRAALDQLVTPAAEAEVALRNERPLSPAPSPIVVSTRRTTGVARGRLPDVISPELRAWHLTQPCAFDCGAGATHMALRIPDHMRPPAAVTHHHPTKGSEGRTDDRLSIPVCADCHRRCHTSVEHGGYSFDLQDLAEQRAWERFTRAPVETQRAVTRQVLEALS